MTCVTGREGRRKSPTRLGCAEAFAGFAQTSPGRGQGLRFQSPATLPPFLHRRRRDRASTMRPIRFASTGVPFGVTLVSFSRIRPSAATAPRTSAFFFVLRSQLPSRSRHAHTSATGQQNGALFGSWLQSRPLYVPSCDTTSLARPKQQVRWARLRSFPVAGDRVAIAPLSEALIISSLMRPARVALIGFPRGFQVDSFNSIVPSAATAPLAAAAFFARVNQFASIPPPRTARVRDTQWGGLFGTLLQTVRYKYRRVT